jgi:CheY-specific phosphatase CheX
MVVQVRHEGELDESVKVLLFGMRDFLETSGKKFRIYSENTSELKDFGASVCGNLQEALSDLQIVQPGELNSEIVEIFCNSTRISLEVQARTNVTFLKPELRVLGKVEPVFSGSIEFSGGGVTGTAIITTNIEVLRAVTERMVGSVEKVKETDIWNVACELINIIAGHAKARMNELGYQVMLSALPSLVTPEFQPMLAVEDGSSGIMIRMNSDLGPMILEIRFYS